MVHIVYHTPGQTESHRVVKVAGTNKKRRCGASAAAQTKPNMENEMDRKPGSVLNDDLSRPAIADRLVPPSGHASSAVRPI